MIRRPPRSTLLPYTTLFLSPSLRLEPSNWIILAVGLPNSIDLFSIVVVTSLRLFDDHRKIGAGGVTLFARSEEHTSELQSQSNLVCRLLLAKNITSSPYRDS